MRALFDVNVLIALMDEAHLGHRVATQWLTRNIRQGWASCPLTQNGCIRIMAQPAYPGQLAAAAVAERLGEAVRDASHRFVPDDFSLLEPGAIDWRQVLGHRQITDHYLLALAVRHECCFVTFDARIRAASVPGARARHLVVLEAA